MKKSHGGFLLFIILTLFSSCKSSKNIDGSLLKKMSSGKVIKKHLASNFSGEIIDARLKVNYKNTKEDIGFSVKMRIKKGEVIWLKGTKVITVFKAKITPEKVSFYSPYRKNYFEGDFSVLKELLGFEVNFNQLQNILLGQTIFNVSDTKQHIEIINKMYQLHPKNQSAVFNISYLVNPNHFKLEKQYMVNKLKNQRLDIIYSKYMKEKLFLFPKHIFISAKQKNKITTIDIDVQSVIFNNSELEMSFKIPLGYKEIRP